MKERIQPCRICDLVGVGIVILDLDLRKIEGDKWLGSTPNSCTGLD